MPNFLALKPLKGALTACREHIILAIILSALVNILYLAPTLYMMQVYDRVVPTSGTATLLWITVFVAVALATLAMLDWIRVKIMVRASLRLERTLSASILDHMMSGQAATSGDVRARQAMREFDVVRAVMGGQPMLALFDMPWTPIYVLVAFIIHPLLALMIVIGGGLLVAIALLNERQTRMGQNDAAMFLAASYSQQERIASRSELVRVLGMRSAMVAQGVNDRARGLAHGMAAQMTAGRYTAAAKFLRLFMQSLVLGLGAWLAIERQISVGAIIAASVLLSRALQPVEQLVAALPAFGQARRAVMTLSLLLETSATDNQVRTALPAPTGEVMLQNISVRADGQNALLLRNISFEVSAGQFVGIVGPSGAGKTTLARVLCGGLIPDLGAVRIDGANRLDWDSEKLARHIGYVAQDCAMLPGTIAENISRFAIAAGESRADVDTRVIEAARLAGAHTMIIAMPGGYDRMLDFEASKLSAGQRQRIALARALYGDPSILVLDEPNSALDAEGEAALIKAIETARERGATIFMIAHRSAVLANADQLLLLSHGTVELYGPRETVVKTINNKTPQLNVVDIKKGTDR